ncbi:MAG TPA: xanthine dehydrogenase family protein molybdopterin-binding subunit [Kofleriaceae bacterium]|nr:xanthine dehydrogenase family protein molybdopterin-binding subunit [Kofleriaceae bacterium]
MKLIGDPIDRVDARRKVTGDADYAADTPVAHVAHAVIVTAGEALGRLGAIDFDEARAAPGVIAVITHHDALHLPKALQRDAKNPGERVLQLLQDDALLYNDQPIAVCVGETLEAAQHAASLVHASFRAERPVVGLEGALATAYKPHAAGPAGETDTARGDVDRALREAALRVDAIYTTPVENHHPMEPHATIAVWHGDDQLTLYDATQGIFGVRDRIAAVFELPKANVRVIDHFVGGGFGCKGAVWSHVALTAMAAKMLGRPVKLAITRPQMCSLVGHRPETRQRLTLACDREGALTAIRHEVFSETSRFDEFVEPSAVQTRMLYACPNVITQHRVVRLDIPTPTFQRAPGESTGTYALECAMDELAHAAAIDPLELRLRNYAELDLGEHKPFSSKSLRECYRRGAEAFGWAKRDPRPRSMRDGRALIGWGMATATYPARQRPSSAIARMTPDGRALVQAGTQDIGTGTYTIMTQIAADALGLPVDAVRFELGDTSFPETPISGGSMTASSTGSAVKAACKALVDKLANLASGDPVSPLYGIAPRDLIVQDGALVGREHHLRREPLASIVARSGQREISAQVRAEPRPDREQLSTHAFGADFVEVRVDPELGEIRIARAVGAFGCGRILNAKTARSQLIGGMVWGIGMALFEHTVRDPRNGRVVTRDLADYHVPVSGDVPDLDVIFVEEDDPHVNELGAKGIGEIGITGMPAAIANAIFHATGTRVRDLPITLDKLL